MKRTSFIVSLTSILVVVAIAVGFFVAGARPQLGLDLQGGISAALQPDPEAGNPPENLDEALARHPHPPACRQPRRRRARHRPTG